MRCSLKRLASIALAVSLSLGTCATSYAGAIGGGGGGGLAPPSGNKGGTGKPYTVNEANCSQAFRVYIATLGELVSGSRPSFGWNGLSAEKADRLAEAHKAVYVVAADIPYMRMWDSNAGRYIDIGSDRIVPVSSIKNMDERGFGVSPGCIMNGASYVQILNATFGDSAGKLDSLLAAMESFSSEAAKFAEVITDANNAEQIFYLSKPEVVEQLNHYIGWWDQVFSSSCLEYPADAKTMAQIKSDLSTISAKAKEYVSSKGKGPGVRDFPFGKYIDEPEDLMTYPVVVIEPIATTTHQFSQFIPCGITHRHTVKYGYSAGGSDIKKGPFETFGPGRNMANLKNPSGAPQKHWCSPGTMFQTKVLDEGDIKAEGSQSNDSGILFYGCFGMIVLNTSDRPKGDPVTPPLVPDETPDEPESYADMDLADFYLLDYEINHVFDSVAEKLRQGDGSHSWMTLGTNQDTTNPGKTLGTLCHGGTIDYDPQQYYTVTYTEGTGSGPSVAMDNAGKPLFLKNNSKYGDNWFHRREALGGITLDTSNISNYTVDYGFNLLRRHFKNDNRIYSLLVDQEVSKTYLDDILGMYEGLMPKNVIDPSKKRDSFSALCAIKDSLSWSAVWQETGDTTRHYTTSESEEHHWTSGGSSHSHTKSYNADHAGNALGAFQVANEGYSSYSWDIISLAHKYRTMSMPTAYVTPKMDSFDIRPTKDQNGGNRVPDDEQYRAASLITTKVELGYYPEVPMLVDEVSTPDLTHEYKPVVTMGEEKRKSRSPMLLLYRLESADSDARGTVYTDTAVGGAASLGTNKVALTAGGDFTVKADTKMTINLYGYALDIIEPSDQSYTEVTRGNDVKAAWGDMANNRSKLLEEYTQWAGAMLSPRNYQADFEMTIGTKQYNNFSATVGGFTTRASNSKEEGSYPLVFRHGDIVKTEQGYKDFIKQLAQDYACSEAEADVLFEASEMKQAVIKSIEHDNSSENKSQAQTIGRDQVQLGSSSHWYDEEVRTIVMRRFMTPQGTFKDIIAQDKMDIGNAMEGNAIQNGQFRLTLWFNAGVYTKSGGGVYIPGPGSDNKSDALASGNIILAGVHITQADFQLTNSTTATGRH